MPRVVLVLCLLVSARAWAQAETYYFSSPPDLGEAESRAIFSPMLALLGSETGQTFEYVYPDSEFAYREDMQSGRFHLLLDDAHYAGWRMVEAGHAPLVRAARPVRFVVIAARAGRIYSKEDLIARALCARPPPDLGTLSILAMFNGPFQVPSVKPVAGALDRLQGLLSGECVGAVLLRRQYTGNEEIRRVAGQFKIITQSDPYPGITLTAAPGVPAALQEAIRRMLLSRAGGEATRTLRERLLDGGDFVEAASEAYEGLDGMLREYPGFDR